MSAPTLKFFQFSHQPPHLQVISAPLCELAHLMDSSLPDCPEKSAGMRKLLEAKDCFVRAQLEMYPQGAGARVTPLGGLPTPTGL